MSATKPTRLATKRSILRGCWPFPLDMGPVVRKLKYELNKRIRVNCFICVHDRILGTLFAASLSAGASGKNFRSTPELTKAAVNSTL